MITENQKLREEMKARHEEHNRVLREVLNELQNIRQKHDDVGNRVRPQRKGKKGKVQVSSACRVSIYSYTWFSLGNVLGHQVGDHQITLFAARRRRHEGARGPRAAPGTRENWHCIYLCFEQKDA